MFERNLGKFTHKLELLKPSEIVRDELGGVADASYSVVAIVNAMQRDKSTTYRQVIGDYVTMDTAYFVIWDISSVYKLDNRWRFRCNGYTYVINTVTRLEDEVPYMLEIEATKIGGIA